MTTYNIFEPWLTLDPWQKEYIETEGNCFLLCGRQSGKTTAMSIKFGDRAAKNPKRIILMIAYTEKQAYNLFFKTLMYLKAVYPSQVITKGVKKHTRHVIHLTNGSMIMCYACGLDGTGIRTFTVTDLVIDEAAPMAREVFTSVTPMISVTGGNIDISSTPRGRSGYFYECSDQCTKVKKNFTRFYVNAEDCPRHSKEFLEDERESMTKLEYAQEYIAKFLDEVKQFFPDELIRSCFKEVDYIKYKGRIPQRDRFMGIDIAGEGKDDTVLSDGYRIEKKLLQVISVDVKPEIKLTELVRHIIEKDKHNHYKKIYLDSGGLGVGVLQPLLECNQTKWKTVGINNSTRIYEHKWAKGKEKGGESRLMKEELYINLKILMENGKIYLPKNDETFQSLKNIQAEDINGQLKIWGKDSHIAESLIRLAECMKDITLNSYIN